MLAAVTAYFNPQRSPARRYNWEFNLNRLRSQRVSTLTVELAYGDQEFELSPSPEIIQLRTNSWCWQKERLINLGAALLPSSVDSILILDADVIFIDPSWVDQALQRLERVSVVQPFQVARNVHGSTFRFLGPEWRSMVSMASPIVRNASYDNHGHSGFAWVVRREVFKVGLFETCLLEGDHLFAHGALRTADSPCVKNCFTGKQRFASSLFDEYQAWATKLGGVLEGEPEALPITLAHLSHGVVRSHEYRSYNQSLIDAGLEASDLQAAAGLPMEWKNSAFNQLSSPIFS